MKSILDFKVDDELILGVDICLVSVGLLKKKSNIKVATILANNFVKSVSKLANAFLARKSTTQPDITSQLVIFTTLLISINFISITGNISLVLA